MIVFSYVNYLCCFKFLIFFVHSFGEQERFNAANRELLLSSRCNDFELEESVFLLSHSFCVQMVVPDANLSVSSYQPWKNMYAEMIQLQVRICVYVVLHSTS